MRFPRPLDGEDLALEALMVANGGFDRFERFRMVFASAVAAEFEEEFGVDEDAVDPFLRPAIDAHLRGVVGGVGARLAAVTNFVDALGPALRGLGVVDRDFRKVGVGGTRLWSCAETAAPFLFSVREEDDPKEDADDGGRFEVGLAGWVGST